MNTQDENQDGSFGSMDNDYIESRRMSASRSSNDVLGKIEKPLMIMGGLIILGALAFFLWSPFKSRVSGPDPALEAVKALDARIVQLEQNLAAINEKFQTPVEDDTKARLDKIESSVFSRLDSLEQKADGLVSRISTVKKQAVAEEAKPAVREKAQAKTRQPAKNKIQNKKADKPKKAQAAYHVVKSGETLYSVSKKYGMVQNDLKKINNLGSANTIVTGQKLKVK